MIDTLIINAHPDPHSTASATNRMVAHLLTKLPAGSVQTVNLAETDIQTLDKAAVEMVIATVFQGQQPNAEQAALFARMMSVVKQVKSARRLVIAYPMYNFGIPARLKDWLDNLVVPDETFRYGENSAPQGLMGEHKVLLLQASGSVYSEGPMAQMDFASSYLKTLLGGFLGFASVDTVYAEGTAGNWEAAVQRACAKINDVYDHFAA
ncbi:FMN-dependent NADH-azoreductase [Neisseria elongata]|uniref:FMN-dependent NADH-azoreductase n=1 Tax=Neisseria elongata TaxID=495 RepID=UPI000D387B64|nr:NAD(P)H-dependent oxidoreductase [Neisseria elongata]